MGTTDTPNTERKTIVEIFAPHQLATAHHEGTDDLRIGVVIDDCVISEPYVSECGRFTVDPRKAYGLSEYQCTLLEDLNGLLEIVQFFEPEKARLMVHQHLGLVGADGAPSSVVIGEPGTIAEYLLRLIMTGSTLAPTRVG